MNFPVVGVLVDGGTSFTFKSLTDGCDPVVRPLCEYSGEALADLTT